MLTPFQSDYAQNYIIHLLKADDAVSYIEHTLQEADNCNDNVPERLCYEIWTAGCLLDIVFNHTEYPNQDSNTLKAVQQIEKDFSKTKGHFLWKEPIHQKSMILDMSDALLKLAVTSEENLSPEDLASIFKFEEDGETIFLNALAEQMYHAGILEEWTYQLFDTEMHLSDYYIAEVQKGKKL